MGEYEAHSRVLGRIDKELKLIRINLEEKGFTAGFSLIRRQAKDTTTEKVMTKSKST